MFEQLRQAKAHGIQNSLFAKKPPALASGSILIIFMFIMWKLSQQDMDSPSN